MTAFQRECKALRSQMVEGSNPSGPTQKIKMDSTQIITQIPKWIFLLAILWSLPWKGIALWKSARNKQKEWFIVLLLVNTLAILEIIYLSFFQKKDKRIKKK